MKKSLQIVLFILLGIPGAFVFVFSSIAIAGKFLDPKADLPNYSVLLVACVLGIIFTLIGIGKIKMWLYALVFISFPLSFWLYALINPNMYGGTISLLIFIAVIGFGTLRLVQYYYGESKRLEGKKNENFEN